MAAAQWKFWGWIHRVAAWPNALRWLLAIVLAAFLVGQMSFINSAYPRQTLVPSFCCVCFGTTGSPRSLLVSLKKVDGAWVVDEEAGMRSQSAQSADNRVFAILSEYPSRFGVFSPSFEQFSNHVRILDDQLSTELNEHPEREAIIRAYAMQRLGLHADSPRLKEMLGEGRPTKRVLWSGVLNDVVIVSAFVVLCGVARTLERPWATMREKRERAGLCGSCGYELAGLRTCPECGEETAEAHRDRVAKGNDGEESL